MTRRHSTTCDDAVSRLEKNDPSLVVCNLRCALLHAETSSGDMRLARVAEAMRQNTILTELDLRSNMIGPVGAISFRQALSRRCPPLASLDLKENVLGNDGAASIAALIVRCHSLTYLNLSANHIGDFGAADIAPSVRYTSIKKLVLNGNRIGDKGAASLATALSRHGIVELGLGANLIANAGAGALAEMIVSNSTLSSVDLHGNRIENGGAEALALALKDASLANINLDNNWIKDAGAIHLADVLIANPRFTTLSLAGNRYGSPGAQALQKCRGEAAARTAAFEKRQRKVARRERRRTQDNRYNECGGHEDCTLDCTIV